MLKYFKYVLTCAEKLDIFLWALLIMLSALDISKIW